MVEAVTRSLNVEQVKYGAAERFYDTAKFHSFLENSHGTRDARRRLAPEVSGLVQQASLFLRMLGHEYRCPGHSCFDPQLGRLTKHRHKICFYACKYEVLKMLS